MHIPIIFEDKHILIINKPSGTVVHPFDFSSEETILDFLQKYRPEIFSIDNPFTLQDKRTINLGGIVHKLDRGTSGILVVAKDEQTFKELRRIFSEHKIEKIYRAVVDGKINEETLHINKPLGRNKKEYKQKVNPENPRGPLFPAETHITVIERRLATTLVELIPKTGRTHQLRAHMAYIGHPIQGDKAYGSTHESKNIALHAQSLSFTLFGKHYFFTAPTPDTFL